MRNKIIKGRTKALENQIKKNFNEVQKVNKKLDQKKKELGTQAMQVSVNELETLFKLVIRKLKQDNILKIDLDMDEYWVIFSNEWNIFEETPTPSVGSLVEDVEYLKKAIQENEIHSYSEFDRLASLIRFISERNAPSK